MSPVLLTRRSTKKKKKSTSKRGSTRGKSSQASSGSNGGAVGMMKALRTKTALLRPMFALAHKEPSMVAAPAFERMTAAASMVSLLEGDLANDDVHEENHTAFPVGHDRKHGTRECVEVDDEEDMFFFSPDQEAIEDEDHAHDDADDDDDGVGDVLEKFFDIDLRDEREEEPRVDESSYYLHRHQYGSAKGGSSRSGSSSLSSIRWSEVFPKGRKSGGASSIEVRRNTRRNSTTRSAQQRVSEWERAMTEELSRSRTSCSTSSSSGRCRSVVFHEQVQVKSFQLDPLTPCFEFDVDDALKEYAHIRKQQQTAAHAPKHRHALVKIASR